jgi:signal peptidase
MLNFLKIYFEFIIAMIVLASAGGLVLYRTQGLRFYSVQTASMAPVLQPGDLAITTKPDINRLQTGDIISYQSSAQPSKIITHRIYQINQTKGYIVTKGDKLNYPDPPITASQLTGKAALAVPKLGYFLDWLRRPIGLVGLIYLPALLITSYELARLMSYYSHQNYGLKST